MTVTPEGKTLCRVKGCENEVKVMGEFCPVHHNAPKGSKEYNEKMAVLSPRWVVGRG
jgi:hypothetical protein